MTLVLLTDDDVRAWVNSLEKLESHFVEHCRYMPDETKDAIEGALHTTLCVFRHDCTCRETKEV